jgi:hypothetical protein
MQNQNPNMYKEILSSHIQKIETDLKENFCENGFSSHLESGTRYNGNGKVEAYLTYRQSGGKGKESIDLNLALSCTERGALFSTQILWSSGRMIDEVIVCEVCPECPDEIGNKVEQLLTKNQEPLVTRLTELYNRFESK